MSAALLRQTVVDTGYTAIPYLIVLIPQALHEVVINLMLGDVRDVFHGHQMRFGFFDEATEVIE